MNSNKALVVVLGLGEMGLVHAENLSKHRQIRLGLASHRKDVLTKTAKLLDADVIYESYDDALDDPSVVGVVIATAVETHPEMIKKAASKKKHILCEKPLGETYSSIKEALDVVKENKVRFMVAFMRRWDIAYSNARQRVVDGQVGNVTVLKCTSGDGKYPEKYFREGQKNAISLDLAVHDIDLARWITKSEVKRVYALVDALTHVELRDRGDGDMGVAILEMESGTKVIVHSSFTFGFGYHAITEIVGQKGTIRVGDFGHVDVDVLLNGVQSRPVDNDYRVRFESAFQKEITAFVHLVLAQDDDAVADLFSQNASYASGHDGLRASIVAEALLKSSRSHMPVEVDYHDEDH